MVDRHAPSLGPLFLHPLPPPGEARNAECLMRLEAMSALPREQLDALLNGLSLHRPSLVTRLGFGFSGAAASGGSASSSHGRGSGGGGGHRRQRSMSAIQEQASLELTEAAAAVQDTQPHSASAGGAATGPHATRRLTGLAPAQPAGTGAAPVPNLMLNLPDDEVHEGGLAPVRPLVHGAGAAHRHGQSLGEIETAHQYRCSPFLFLFLFWLHPTGHAGMLGALMRAYLGTDDIVLGIRHEPCRWSLVRSAVVIVVTLQGPVSSVGCCCSQQRPQTWQPAPVRCRQLRFLQEHRRLRRLAVGHLF